MRPTIGAVHFSADNQRRFTHSKNKMQNSGKSREQVVENKTKNKQTNAIFEKYTSNLAIYYVATVPKKACTLND